MLLEDALKGYFMSISADGYSQSTIRMYRWSLGMMAQIVGNKEMNDIQPEDLQKFWIYMREEYVPHRKNKSTAPLSGRSLENIWTSLRSFFGWAEKERRVGLHFRPDLAIKQPKYTQTVIPPFTEDEIKRMFKVAELMEPAKSDARRKGGYRMRRPTADRDIALLWLLLDTGLRASEVHRLKIKDVNLENGHIQVAPFGTGQKTKARTVYLGRPARKALWRYIASREELRQEDPLFLTRENRAMDRNAIRCLTNDLGARAGVEGNAHPHRFRHTFAYLFIKNGGEPFNLMEIAGWAKIEMAMRYVTMAGKDSTEIHRKVAPSENLRF